MSKRARTLSLFAAFIVFQLLMPLSYYASDNRYDERFAWRMFSEIRSHQCRPQMFAHSETGVRPVALPSEFHQVWINLLGRQRDEVIEAAMLRICENGAARVTLRNACVEPRDGETYELESEMTCNSGELVLP